MHRVGFWRWILSAVRTGAFIPWLILGCIRRIARVWSSFGVWRRFLVTVRLVVILGAVIVHHDGFHPVAIMGMRVHGLIHWRRSRVFWPSIRPIARVAGGHVPGNRLRWISTILGLERNWHLGVGRLLPGVTNRVALAHESTPEAIVTCSLLAYAAASRL